MRPFEDRIKRFIDFYDDLYPTLVRHSNERAVIYKQKSDKLNLIGFPSDKQQKIEDVLREV